MTLASASSVLVSVPGGKVLPPDRLVGHLAASSLRSRIWDVDVLAEAIAPALEGLASPDHLMGQFYRMGYWFSQSPYTAFLEHIVPEEERAPLKEADLARLQAGVEFEESYTADLIDFQSELGRPVVQIRDDHEESLELKKFREAQTVAAMLIGVAHMRAGRPGQAPIIVGGRLPAAFSARVGLNLVGKPDLIVPNFVAEDPSRSTYLFGDVKDAGTLEGTAKPRAWLVSDLLDPLLTSAEEREIGRGLPKKKHRLQLAHYLLQSEPLFELFGLPHHSWGAIVGREQLAVWADVKEPLYGRGKSKSSAFDEYLDLVEGWKVIDELGRRAAAGEQVVLPYHANPDKRPACSSCPFRKHCERERNEEDRLSRHPDIGAAGSAKLAEVLPSPTVGALAHADPVKLAADIVEAGISGFGSSDEAVLASVHSLVDGARAMMQNRAYRRRDRRAVPTLEAVVELHVDLENNNNPMVRFDDRTIPAGHLAQTGVLVKTGLDDYPDTLHTRYYPWFSDGTPEGEAKAIADWWRFVEGQRKKAVRLYDELKAQLGSQAMSGVVPFRIYTYTKAEHRIWRAKSAEFEGVDGIPSTDQLDELLAEDLDDVRNVEVLDLHAFLKAYIHLPLEDRKLKTVGPYVGHYWSVDDPSGDMATLYMAEMYASEPDSPEFEAARTWLWKYNKDDCVANLAVRRWIDATPFTGVEKLEERGIFRLHIPRRAARPSAPFTDPSEQPLQPRLVQL